MTIIIFANTVKGVSAPQISIALGAHLFLVHKLRTALMDSQNNTKLEGVIEIGGYYVRKTKPENKKRGQIRFKSISKPKP